MSEQNTTSRGMSHVRWSVCAMLFAATSINYMDRQVIAILKPTLEQSIGMSDVGFGYIVATFQVSYALGLLLMGRLVDRIGTRIGYMIVMAIWSLAAMGHSLASTVTQFAMARFALGIGESGNFPTAIKTTAEWFPQSERSLATGIFNSGSNLGAILAPILIPWVTLRWGWHAAFLATGAFSASWILLWFFNYRKPSVHPSISDEELDWIGREETRTEVVASITWARLIRLRQTWAFTLAKFLTDPIWWFYLFWMPDFFSKHYGLDLAHLGLPLILIYNASAVGSIGGGWLPVPFIRMGIAPGRARIVAMSLCAVAVVPVFTITAIHSEWLAVAILSVAAGAHQGWSANLYTTTSDMFPRHAVGSVNGIGGMAGSLGGVLLAYYAGHILQLTHSYTSLFVIASSAYLIALFLLTTLAPGLTPARITGAAQ